VLRRYKKKSEEGTQVKIAMKILDVSRVTLHVCVDSVAPQKSSVESLRVDSTLLSGLSVSPIQHATGKKMSYDAPCTGGYIR
jgi:hypothetical protein